MISDGWGRASPGGRITGAGGSRHRRRISWRAGKALDYITIEKRLRRHGVGGRSRWNRCLRSRGAKKCALLGLEDATALSKEALRNQGHVANVCWGIEVLKCHGIGAVMVDNDVTMIDEEHMCCCKIAGLQAGVGCRRPSGTHIC